MHKQPLDPLRIAIFDLLLEAEIAQKNGDTEKATQHQTAAKQLEAELKRLQDLEGAAPNGDKGPMIKTGTAANQPAS